MTSKILIIYEYQILYKILSEINEYLNFEILYVDKKKFQELEFDKFENYLILSSVKSTDLKNSFVLENLPIKLYKLIQIININFLKTSFTKKSDVKIGKGIKGPSVNLNEFTKINLQNDILYEFNRLNI